MRKANAGSALLKVDARGALLASVELGGGEVASVLRSFVSANQSTPVVAGYRRQSLNGGDSDGLVIAPNASAGMIFASGFDLANP